MNRKYKEQLLYFTEAMESSIADMVFSPECENCNIITDNFIKFKSKLKDIEDDFQLRELQGKISGKSSLIKLWNTRPGEK